MAKIPLLGGAYQAQSLIADCQRCVNLYPEINPEGAAFPVTHYQTPGLRVLVERTPQIGSGGWRGLYTSSLSKATRQLYGVYWNEVYRIGSDWALHLLGTIGSYQGQVSMQDNGTTLLLVDGTPNGYQIDLATDAFAPYAPDGFYGANVVQYLDTFFIFNRPGTREFYISLSNESTLDPTDRGSKTGQPDLLQTLAVLHREIWLLGTKTTEIWYNSGAALFPFEEFPGVFIDHGCDAVYSPAHIDESLFWLVTDEDGHALVVQGQQYQVKRVSNHAIEQLLNSYGDLSDAISFTYQMNGHSFYWLTLPRADVTWVYDTTTQQWHQRAWADSSGKLHRHRANCHAFCYDTHVVGDWADGKLYSMEVAAHDDAGVAIQRIRGFPHLIVGFDQNDKPISADGKTLSFRRFIADMEVGEWNNPANPPEISLRWSDTKGKTWGSYVKQQLGNTGEFQTSIQWLQLGAARDRVFELSWSVAMKTALNGAYIDPLVWGK